MRRFATWMILAVTGVLAQSGCRDDAPPPPRVPVPAAGNRDQIHERDYVKPLPPDLNPAQG